MLLIGWFSVADWLVLLIGWLGVADWLARCCCSKVQNYSTTGDSAKVFEKPVNRKAGVRFQPRQALEVVRREPLPPVTMDSQRRELVQAYLDVSRSA